MGWTSSSFNIHRVQTSKQPALLEKTLPNWAKYELKQGAEVASEAKRFRRSRSLSKSLKRWWDRWQQMPATVDFDPSVDTDAKGEIELAGESGRKPFFVRKVTIQGWQGYGPVKEMVHLRDESRLSGPSPVDFTGFNEWFHNGQSYQEEISLEILPTPVLKPGRFSRTKEWLTNHRNSSRVSFFSSSLSPSSQQSFFRTPNTPNSASSSRDSHSSELPVDIFCALHELADTSPVNVRQTQTPLQQTRISVASVAPQYSVPEATESDQNGLRCGAQESYTSSKVEPQIYQFSPISSVDGCASPPLKGATDFDNEHSLNEGDPQQLTELSPLVDQPPMYQVTAMTPNTEVLAFHGFQKGDSAEIQLPDPGPIFDLPLQENSIYQSHRQTANYSNNENGGSYLGDGTRDSSFQSSALGNGGDGCGTEGHGNCDESENNSREEDDDGNNRKRKRFKRADPGRTRRQFACVYHKYDPQTYHGDHHRKYLLCSGTSFKFISELTRHLCRVHGEHVCPHCYRTFRNKTLRANHAQNCTVKLRCSQEDKWAALWRERFKGVDMPQSPYWEPSSGPRLARLNTRTEGFPQQQWTDASGSATTYNPSPCSSGSSTMHPHYVGDLRQNPNENALMAQLQSTTAIQRISIAALTTERDALRKQVPCLGQQQLWCSTCNNITTNFPVGSLISPTTTNNSPNGALSSQSFTLSNVQHPGGTTTFNTNLGQPTPSTTPIKERARSSILKPPATMVVDTYAQQADPPAGIAVPQISEPVFQQEEHQSFSLPELDTNMNFGFDWDEIQSSVGYL
ncbi:hypothetical protein, variant 1 [Blastomyces dermatitidis ATCC 26199]|nr:hypothetical protein BDFG_02454 [Blastomyces dermatitidis ATCC 26199]EQL35838.1 hypothetical protein, variant 1 [Blastomyces dermatitidis ATCC 26199]